MRALPPSLKHFSCCATTLTYLRLSLGTQAGVFARRGFNIESLAVGLWGPQQDKVYTVSTFRFVLCLPCCAGSSIKTRVFWEVVPLGVEAGG